MKTTQSILFEDYYLFWQGLSRPEKTEFIRSYEQYFNKSYDTFRKKLIAGKLTPADKDFFDKFFEEKAKANQDDENV